MKPLPGHCPCPRVLSPQLSLNRRQVLASESVLGSTLVSAIFPTVWLCRRQFSSLGLELKVEKRNSYSIRAAVRHRGSNSPQYTTKCQILGASPSMFTWSRDQRKQDWASKTLPCEEHPPTDSWFLFYFLNQLLEAIATYLAISLVRHFLAIKDLNCSPEFRLMDWLVSANLHAENKCSRACQLCP